MQIKMQIKQGSHQTAFSRGPKKGVFSSENHFHFTLRRHFYRDNLPPPPSRPRHRADPRRTEQTTTQSRPRHRADQHRAEQTDTEQTNTEHRADHDTGRPRHRADHDTEHITSQSILQYSVAILAQDCVAQVRRAIVPHLRQPGWGKSPTRR